MLTNKHYVYAWYDPSIISNNLLGYEVFYIGKGTNSRYLVSVGRNRHFSNRYKKIVSKGFTPKSIVLAEFDSEEDALELEAFLIYTIGRRISGEGTLTNQSMTSFLVPDDYVRVRCCKKPNLSKSMLGNTIRSGIPHSDETRSHLSEVSLGPLNHFFGKKHSDESRKKISLSLTGRSWTLERRLEASESRKGNKSYGRDVSNENNPMYGRSHSDLTRQRMRDAVRPAMSDEGKRNISLATKGKLKSESTKERMREASRIRNEDPNTKARILAKSNLTRSMNKLKRMIESETFTETDILRQRDVISSRKEIYDSIVGKV